MSTGSDQTGIFYPDDIEKMRRELQEASAPDDSEEVRQQKALEIIVRAEREKPGRMPPSAKDHMRELRTYAGVFHTDDRLVEALIGQTLRQAEVEPLKLGENTLAWLLRIMRSIAMG